MELISRDGAIAMLEDMEGRRDEDGYVRVYKTDVIANLRSLPSIDFIKCGECKHRDPEDKKCDCGMFERQGCIFPVADDYFCKYGERRSE